MKLERIRLGGIGALRRGGEGAPFVLLHGIGSAPESFLPLVGACLLYTSPSPRD